MKIRLVYRGLVLLASLHLPFSPPLAGEGGPAEGKGIAVVLPPASS